MTENAELLFVYGTLMRPFSHPMGEMLRARATFIGEASIVGTLYDFGHYPGIVESLQQDQHVFGELYCLPNAPDVLQLLDHYEGCGRGSPTPHLFVRKKVAVQLDSAKRAEAWAYFYNREPYDGVHIAEGRFTR